MHRDAYAEAVLRTWNGDHDSDAQVCNAVLGVVGEVGEYVDNPSPDELGDVLYYKAMVRQLLDTRQTNTVAMKTRDLPREAARLAEATKKYVFHDAPLNPAVQALSRLEFCLYHEADLRGWDLSDVRQQNIDKLRDRYPNGFTT